MIELCNLGPGCDLDREDGLRWKKNLPESGSSDHGSASSSSSNNRGTNEGWTKIQGIPDDLVVPERNNVDEDDEVATTGEAPIPPQKLVHSDPDAMVTTEARYDIACQP